MHRHADGTLGNIEQTNEIPFEKQTVSCIAVLREPSEILKINCTP